MVQTAITIIRTAIVRTETSSFCRIFQNYFSDIETVARLDGQGYRPDARVRDSIFYLN
jgi:hypothetical protein